MASTKLTTTAKAKLDRLLKVFAGPTNRTVLFPWIPFPVKLLVFLVFLINWRSWPLMWHWRVWKSVFVIRWDRFRRARTIPTRRKWVGDISCVNADPMEVISITKGYAGIDDCDYNAHLSNSCYAKAVDAARMRSAMQIFPAIFGDGAWMPLAGAQYHFIREIPIYTEYEIRSTIGGWEDKWMYLVHHFVSYPKKGSKSKATRVSRAASASAGAPSVTAPSTPEMMGTPPKTASPPPMKQRPEYKAPPTVPAWLVRKPLPEGAVIHCVAVSLYCFKIGRLTIPPKVAFIAAGFGAPEKRRWLRVQGLRFSPDPTSKDGVKNLMTDMLKGGYKTDNGGGDRFWELDEFEERRVQAMEDIFDGFQGSLKGLKEAPA